jgi:hypothetical protein
VQVYWNYKKDKMSLLNERTKKALLNLSYMLLRITSDDQLLFIFIFIFILFLMFSYGFQ